MKTHITKVHCLQPLAKQQQQQQQQQQQMAAQHVTHWESGLWDCFEEANTCCYGFWCCPCLACTVSKRFGENRCLPLCDIFSMALVTGLGVPLVAPPAVLSLRVAMRHRYGIKGSICKDITVACCCCWCSWCQMHREIKRRTTPLTVVMVQQPSVVQLQPSAMQLSAVQLQPSAVQPSVVQLQPSVVQLQSSVVQLQPSVVQLQQPSVVHLQQPSVVHLQQPAPVLMGPEHPPPAGFVI
ncbi:uncharacterized protein LOC130194127 [Pseudoliparis swirei]|uniref:uncharacterized protein LOC130194127 n=1 Tax=Pseudoliparis swirei TaxID=2059687 RepID=UPI0024BE2D0F|nr:uncharacterized protein LOC130194127 [Pseudoliparis swirei]